MAEKELFLKPKLNGLRFEGGAVPLEFLKDFSVLEEMILEVAKWKFFESNPHRKRVPRKFTEGMSLKLTGVEDGSAKLAIYLFFAPGLFSPTTAKSYIDDSRTAIVSAISAAEKGTSITDHLPKKS